MAHSIASHLASKWGAAVHEELLYLMPHRMHVSVLPTFLLNSSSSDGGMMTWSSSDRCVQASDVYVDFGQVSSQALTKELMIVLRMHAIALHTVVPRG